MLGSLAATLLLIAGAIACWCSKNRHRQIQRLERRNSIRQSLHSLRSVGSSHGFTDLGYRRGKPTTMVIIIISSIKKKISGKKFKMYEFIN